MVTQIPLEFNIHATQVFDNYHKGPNEQAIETLKSCASADGVEFVFLWGESGLGKSHLLQACCQLAFQCQFQAVYLPLKERNDFDVSILEGMESCQLVCLDDIDLISGDNSWEEAVFHFFNRLRDNAGHLIVSASNTPTQVGFHLADLKSRLSWGLTTKLSGLSDQDKLAALTLKAETKGFELPAGVGKYLLARFPRDMNSLWTLLETLDRATLAAKRRLTIPFVKACLQRQITARGSD